MADLQKRQASVHAALCDSFNTPKAMQDIKDIVALGNSYMNDAVSSRRLVNTEVLSKVAQWVMRMMKCFGIVNSDLQFGLGQVAECDSSGADRETIAAPFLKVLAEYRDAVRGLAQSKADHADILKATDKLRDEDLIELGVKLDDRADGKALVKFVDRDILIAQRDEKTKRDAEKKLEKEARRLEEERKKTERLEKGKRSPDQLFKDAESLKLYSKWDEKGIPTHDVEGTEIAKSKRKKLDKEYLVQVKLHDEYLKSL